MYRTVLQIGNSRCLFKFKDVVSLYMLQGASLIHNYAVVYTSTRCLAHDITHSISLLSSFALRASKDSNTYNIDTSNNGHHLSEPSIMPMHGPVFSCMHTIARDSGLFLKSLESTIIM